MLSLIPMFFVAYPAYIYNCGDSDSKTIDLRLKRGNGQRLYKDKGFDVSQPNSLAVR